MNRLSWDVLRSFVLLCLAIWCATDQHIWHVARAVGLLATVLTGADFVDSTLARQAAERAKRQ